MNGPQRVQVFSIVLPAPGPPKDKRRYRVKWRIDGRDKTRTFKVRAQAERLRSRLAVAAADGERFDVSVGLPESWLEAPPAPTWWAWSEEWVALKWPQWSGHSRRSVVESLTAITPLMVRPGAPVPSADVVSWLPRCGYRPGAVDGHDVPSWLRTWSVGLADIDIGLLERVLQQVTTRADGTDHVGRGSEAAPHHARGGLAIGGAAGSAPRGRAVRPWWGRVGLSDEQGVAQHPPAS